MAYKFQTLAATMSGSLTQEGTFTVKNDAGTTAFTATDAGVVSGSGNFSAGGTVSLLGVAQAAVAIAEDSLYYFDATDGKMKRETVGAFMADIAGDGLAAASNQLAVQVDDSTIETDSDALRLKDDGVTGAKLAPAVAGAGLVQDGSGNLDVGAGSLIDVNANDVAVDLTEAAAATIAASDHLIFLDGGATGAASKGSTDDLATLFAGDGLSAASAVISIATSGSALTIASDKLGISGSIAGDCLDKGPGDGVDSIRTLHVVADESTIESVGRASLRIKDDGVTGAKLAPAVAGVGLAQDGSGNLDLALSELTAETIASGDFLAFQDVTDDGTHKETVDDLAALFAGAGLAASSAVIAVANATNGGLAINANDMQVDLNDLSAATVNVGADSIAIIDADDSNGTKKESIVDFVAGIAGAGLSAGSGQLSVQGNSVALKADGNALVEGYNYFADLSSNATVTMPASPSVGDVVTVKAGNLTSGANIIVNKGSADHRMDGLESLRIESPFGAITMVYVVADAWRIV